MAGMGRRTISSKAGIMRGIESTGKAEEWSGWLRVGLGEERKRSHRAV